MGAAEFLLTALVLAFCVPVALVVVGAANAVYRQAHPHSPCAPHRYASLTASTPQRRPLPPTVAPRRQLQPWAAEYAVARPIDVDAIRAGSVTYDLSTITAPQEVPAPQQVPAPPVPVEVPEPCGIPVDDWPTRIVQPVPLTRR